MLAAIPVCYDLGRRLGGPIAGATAALLASLSPFVQIYASFGRPYAVFIFTSAVALDLFVRALERRTLAAAAWAAAAAALVPASHTFGFYLVAAEAAVGLAVWRLRPVRGLVVAGLGAVLLVPDVLAAQRLAERFAVERTIDVGARPETAVRQVFYAVIGSSAGRPLFWLVAALALLGLVVVFRSGASVGALVLALLLLPPAAYLFVAIGGGERLEGVAPRHLAFLLPVWTALVGVGLARLVRDRPAWLGAVGVAAVGLVAVLAPRDGLFDARTSSPGYAANGELSALRGPARLLRSTIARRDVLYPHSQAFLPVLAETRRAHPIMLGAGRIVARSFERTRFPVAGAVVAVPVGPAHIDSRRLESALGAAEATVFDRWVIVRAPGPFPDERAALEAIATAQAGVADAASGTTIGFRDYFRSRQRAVCRRLDELGSSAEPCAGTSRLSAR